jgi:endonuclease YncB( thermonuclease family)
MAAAKESPAERTPRGRAPVYSEANPPRAGDEGVFYGPLTSVTDGDSFRARIQGVDMEFRLYAVDAPEVDQAYGARSKSQLRSLLDGQQLVIVFIDVDRYGRVIADVWRGNLHVNREMVAQGAAHFYPEYARDNALFEIEQQARDARRGLWGLPVAQRTEPWVWREQKRAAKNPASSASK